MADRPADIGLYRQMGYDHRRRPHLHRSVHAVRDRVRPQRRRPADGEQRADNLKRRNMAAAQAAEMLFQTQYESRIEFDRRKKRDEDQQAALAEVISKRKRLDLTSVTVRLNDLIHSH